MEPSHLRLKVKLCVPDRKGFPPGNTLTMRSTQTSTELNAEHSSGAFIGKRNITVNSESLQTFMPRLWLEPNIYQGMRSPITRRQSRRSGMCYFIFIKFICNFFIIEVFSSNSFDHNPTNDIGKKKIWCFIKILRQLI